MANTYEEILKKAGVTDSTKIKEAETALKGLTSATTEFSDALNNINPSDILDEVKDKFNNMTAALKQTPGALGAIGIALAGASKSFDDLKYGAMQGVSGIDTFYSRYDKLANLLRNEKGGLSASSEIFKKLGLDGGALQAGADKAGKGLKDYAIELMQTAKNQYLLRDALLASAAQSGQLINLTNDMGGSLENLEKYTEGVNTKLRDFIRETDLSEQESVGLFKTLMTIPGALNMVASATATGTTQNRQFSEALVALSRGTQIPVSELTKQVTTLRDSFNLITTGPKGEGAGDRALQFLASMSEASNQLGLDFGSLESNINSIATQFKMYGDTSHDVVNGFYEVAKGLEATGLSAKSSGELAQSYISHFKELTTAQKAYISQMTGGPGGLQGAFDIDNLLRQGKFEDVFKKVKETMRMNLGGDLVSLDEASQSQAAASQYQRQLSMLQSGPLGAFAKSSDEAERFLDAMKKSDEGNIAPLKDAADSLKDSYKAGKDRQSKTTSFQDKMESSVSDIRLHSQVIAFNTMQYAAGKPPSGPTVMGEKDQLKAFKDRMDFLNRELPGRLEPSSPYDVGKMRENRATDIEYMNQRFGDLGKSFNPFDTKSRLTEELGRMDLDVAGKSAKDLKKMLEDLKKNKPEEKKAIDELQELIKEKEGEATAPLAKDAAKVAKKGTEPATAAEKKTATTGKGGSTGEEDSPIFKFTSCKVTCAKCQQEIIDALTINPQVGAATPTTRP